ncbi:MAG: ABC transporter permease, partial [Oscillospiraceae bacterium]
QEEVEFTVSDDTKKTYLVVPTDEIEEIISLKNPKTKEKISLDNSGAIITQKLAKMLKLKADGSIKINFDDKEYNIKVSGITENYTYNYIYLTKEYYKEIFNQDVKINNALIKFTDDLQREEFLEEAVKKDYIAATVKVSDIAKTFDDVVNSLISIVIVIIISSGTLAFVVLYSLTEINVSERIRELATLKVLGFYDKELSSYIFRENIVFAVAGIALGLFGGVFLTKFVIATAET